MPTYLSGTRASWTRNAVWSPHPKPRSRIERLLRLGRSLGADESAVSSSSPAFFRTSTRSAWHAVGKSSVSRLEESSDRSISSSDAHVQAGVRLALPISHVHPHGPGRQLEIELAMVETVQSVVSFANSPIRRGLAGEPDLGPATGGQDAYSKPRQNTQNMRTAEARETLPHFREHHKCYLIIHYELANLEGWNWCARSGLSAAHARRDFIWTSPDKQKRDSVLSLSISGQVSRALSHS